LHGGLCCRWIPAIVMIVPLDVSALLKLECNGISSAIVLAIGWIAAQDPDDLWLRSDRSTGRGLLRDRIRRLKKASLSLM
jgi:hypothetical protein